MRRKNDLPIILSHNTRTAIMSFHNRKMGGVDVVIVGLNKELPTGGTFEMEDIEWTKGVLHFADCNSLRVTIDVLQKELKRWKEEAE